MDVDLKVNDNADKGLRTAQDDREENGVDQEETDHSASPQVFPHTEVRKARTEPSTAHAAVSNAHTEGSEHNHQQVGLRRYKSAQNNVPVEEVERVEELGNYLSPMCISD